MKKWFVRQPQNENEQMPGEDSQTYQKRRRKSLANEFITDLRELGKRYHRLRSATPQKQREQYEKQVGPVMQRMLIGAKLAAAYFNNSREFMDQDGGSAQRPPGDRRHAANAIGCGNIRPADQAPPVG